MVCNTKTGLLHAKNSQTEWLGLNAGMLKQCLVLYAGIWAGLLIHSYVLILVAGFTVLTSAIGRIESAYYQLLFTLPFTVIYKLSPTSTSLFVYVMLAVGIVLFFRTGRFRGKQFLLIMLFAIYAVCGMGNNYVTVVKMILALLLLYIFVHRVQVSDFKNHIMAFALGVIGSSVIGLFKMSWPRLTVYFDDIDTIIVSGDLSFRFSGLYYDPNYFAIAAVLAIFLSALLLSRKEVHPIFSGVVIVALGVFGFLTYSKMYLLMLALMVLIAVARHIKKPKQFIATCAVTLVLGLVFVIWAQNLSYFETMLSRLDGKDISTGRLDIWSNYLQYIFSSPKTLFLGDGLGAPTYMGRGTHNAYIELVYLLGLCGGGVLLATLISIVNSKRYLSVRRAINYIPILLFCIMIATLGMVTLNDLMFYCMLLWLALNIDTVQQQEGGFTHDSRRV